MNRKILLTIVALTGLAAIAAKPVMLNLSASGTSLTTAGDLTVSGDIAVTGTVDGRDVASDGGKLDLIEAQADVTDAANVGAASANLDDTDASIEWEDATDLDANGALVADCVAPAEMADADHGDVAWSGGAATVQAVSGVAILQGNTIGVTIDGAGSAITTGAKGYIRIPFDCTIVGVYLLADQSGSAVVDVWKDTWANYPPTDADSITASAPPTLSADDNGSDTTLTGWTTTVSAGDVIGFSVDSASTITRLTLQLQVTRN